MADEKLIDDEEVLRRYPALATPNAKKPTYRLEYLRRRGAIPTVKILGRYYYDPEEVEAWINSQKIPARGVK